MHSEKTKNGKAISLQREVAPPTNNVVRSESQTKSLQISNVLGTNLKRLNSYGAVSLACSDLFGTPLNSKVVAQATHLFTANFGVDYSEKDLADKVKLLFTRALANNWSNERFMRAVEWFIDTKKYVTWTVADFMEAPLEAPVSNRAWMQQYLEDHIKSGMEASTVMNHLECYVIQDSDGKNVQLWREINTTPLPCERVWPFHTKAEEPAKELPADRDTVEKIVSELRERLAL